MRVPLVSNLVTLLADRSPMSRPWYEHRHNLHLHFSRISPSYRLLVSSFTGMYITHPHVRCPRTSMPTHPLCAPECSLILSLSDPLECIITSFNPFTLLIDTLYFRYLSRFLFPMEAYDTPFLRSMKQAALASDPLAVALLKRWDDQFTPDVLAQATTALGELWNNEAAGICDALRWGVLRGPLVVCLVSGRDFNPQGNSTSLHGDLL